MKPPLSRKLLLVAREPQFTGWTLMIELGGRTKSCQLTEEIGARLMERFCDIAIEEVVQHGGLSTPAIVTTARRK